MADSDVITYKLEGDRDIVAAFKDLRDYIPHTALRNSMRQGAALLYSALLQAVPYRTGKLARNLIVRTQVSGNWVRARVTVNTIGKASNALNAFYWRFLEKGWHDRAGKLHQEEFLQSVAEGNAQAAAQLVIDSIGVAIDRAAAQVK